MSHPTYLPTYLEIVQDVKRAFDRPPAEVLRAYIDAGQRLFLRVKGGDYYSCRDLSGKRPYWRMDVRHPIRLTSQNGAHEAQHLPRILEQSGGFRFWPVSFGYLELIQYTYYWELRSTNNNVPHNPHGPAVIRGCVGVKDVTEIEVEYWLLGAKVTPEQWAAQNGVQDQALRLL